MQAAKHILCYLAGTTNLGIIYTARTAGDLVIYADAAYANARKFKSTISFCALIAGGPVIWTSRCQPVIAQSTTESEYITMADAAKQAIWICHFLYTIWKSNVYRKEKTTIYNNNKGSLELT